MNTQLEDLSEKKLISDRRLRCSMTCTCVKSESGDFLVRYGLRFKRLAKVIRDIPDISGNAKALMDFMLSLNRNRISEHHIDDVIADYLAVAAE